MGEGQNILKQTKKGKRKSRRFVRDGGGFLYGGVRILRGEGAKLEWGSAKPRRATKPAYRALTRTRGSKQPNFAPPLKIRAAHKKNF